jgi:hypothetical protein
MYGNNFYTVHKGAVVGVVGFDGQWAVPLRFKDVYGAEYPEYILALKGAPATVKTARQGLYFKTFDGTNMGLWHLTKGEVVPPAYDGFDILGKDGPIAATQQGKTALLDAKGKPITEWYGDNSIFMAPQGAKGYVVLGNENAEYRPLNTTTGKFLSQEVYQEFDAVNTATGHVSFKLNGLWSLHAPDGRKLTPSKYIVLRECEAMTGLMNPSAATLPAGRKAIACGAYQGPDGKMVYVVLDEEGKEY